MLQMWVTYMRASLKMTKLRVECASLEVTKAKKTRLLVGSLVEVYKFRSVYRFNFFKRSCFPVVDCFNVKTIKLHYGNGFTTYYVLTHIAPELLQYLTPGIQAELTEFAFGNIHLKVLKCNTS
jgi:hypothetical protein